MPRAFRLVRTLRATALGSSCSAARLSGAVVGWASAAALIEPSPKVFHYRSSRIGITPRACEYQIQFALGDVRYRLHETLFVSEGQGQMVAVDTRSAFKPAGRIDDCCSASVLAQLVEVFSPQDIVWRGSLTFEMREFLEQFTPSRHLEPLCGVRRDHTP